MLQVGFGHLHRAVLTHQATLATTKSIVENQMINKVVVIASSRSRAEKRSEQRGKLTCA